MQGSTHLTARSRHRRGVPEFQILKKLDQNVRTRNALRKSFQFLVSRLYDTWTSQGRHLENFCLPNLHQSVLNISPASVSHLLLVLIWRSLSKPALCGVSSRSEMVDSESPSVKASTIPYKRARLLINFFASSS